jgi:hypothetical protein
MIADCPDCAPDGAHVREPSRARARLPWLSLLPAILYALAPKCPLCLVVYLSAFGVTFGMASLALSVLGPLAVASVVLALGFPLRRAVWTGIARKSAFPSLAIPPNLAAHHLQNLEYVGYP